MTNADQEAAIRERMARTGENYTTAKRAIKQARRDDRAADDRGSADGHRGQG